MKKSIAYLVVIQPQNQMEKPEQRVFKNAEELMKFINSGITTIIVSEVTLYE